MTKHSDLSDSELFLRNDSYLICLCVDITIVKRQQFCLLVDVSLSVVGKT